MFRHLLLLGFMTLGTACGPGAQGDQFWEDGEYADAVAVYETAQGLSSAQIQRYARSLSALNRLDEAAQVLAPVPESQRSEDGWLVLGRIAMQSGDHAGAVELFQTGWERTGEPATRFSGSVRTGPNCTGEKKITKAIKDSKNINKRIS